MTERVLCAVPGLRPLRPDAAGDLPAYRAWRRDRQAWRLARRDGQPEPGPAVAVLMVVDNPEPLWLRRSLHSVVTQTHRPGHLSLVVCGNPSEAVESVLTEELSGLGPAQLSRVPAAAAMSGAEAMALAFEQADAPFVLMLGHHDELAPDALALLAEAVAAAPLAYGDEDEVDGVGAAWRPALKPDWSPDLLMSTAYLGRPLLARASLVVESGGIRSLEDGEWEHDLMLRMTEHADQVAHVAEVLYSRRSETDLDGYASSTSRPRAREGAGSSSGGGPAAVAGAAVRRGERGVVEAGPSAGTWRFRRTPPERTSVSAIVPFRDGAGFLRTCMDSVTATTDDVDLQFVLVDNGSVEPETLSLIERLEARDDVTLISDDRSFNWAALNNAAVQAARGDVLLFLNNDIEAPHPGWLGTLAAQALRPDVAAVGARLLYPGGRVQHCGVVIGIGAAGHSLVGLPADEPGYLGLATLTRDCSAVTGACMAVSRPMFEELGGFDEALGIDTNDIDFCLRARQRGYRIVYEPLAELIHYESPSRGKTGTVPDIRRFMLRWDELIESGDPFLNPHLTRLDGSCALRRPEEQEQLHRWRQILQGA
ncbi:MAG TPA: glycosyltransferase family 2 protein [Acidimicrobiales bacterium]|nr:glycosyltransferase family 2 protein [Acidimicrobiales bacterium]